MDLEMKMKIKQMIEIHDDDNNEDYFLIEYGGEWVRISKEEYNDIRGRQ